MSSRAIFHLLTPALLLCLSSTGTGWAQDSGTTPREPGAILEIAGSSSADLKGEGSSFGTNIAVEITPIEHWLELELELHRFFGVITQQSGILIFYLRNPGIFRDSLN